MQPLQGWCGLPPATQGGAALTLGYVLDPLQGKPSGRFNPPRLRRRCAEQRGLEPDALDMRRRRSASAYVFLMSTLIIIDRLRNTLSYGVLLTGSPFAPKPRRRCVEQRGRCPGLVYDVPIELFDVIGKPIKTGCQR